MSLVFERRLPDLLKSFFFCGMGYTSLGWYLLSTLDEIDGVIIDCDVNKSLGLDGFIFAFIKGFWDLLRPKVETFFEEFYSIAKLPRVFTSYFVTLIPKIHYPF